MKYIGIDIAKEINHACIMDSRGKVLDRPAFGNTSDAIRGFLKAARKKHGKFVVGCEATGYMWSKLCDACMREKAEFKLGNPYKMKVIWMTANKNDKNDAEKIADLLRRDAFPACHLGDQETRSLRDLMRSVIALVHDRTRICNRLRALLVKYDVRINAAKIYSNKALTQLKGTMLGSHVDNMNVQRLVKQLEFYNREIGLAEKGVLLEAANSKFAPQVRLLVSFTGIDVYAAMLLAAEIDGIKRFGNARKLVSMVGMCPSVYQSGNSLRHGRMKKLDVNRKLNWLMIQVASVAVRHDDRMKEYYERVKKRHGGKHAIAITHVANKMLHIMWYMLRDGEPYRNRDERLYQSKLARLDKAMHSNKSQATKG